MLIDDQRVRVIRIHLAAEAGARAGRGAGARVAGGRGEAGRRGAG